MKVKSHISYRIILLVASFLGLICMMPEPVAAAVTVTPSTWNVVGLDSNRPLSGPYRFPVGARVCGGTPSATDTATFTWDAGGSDSGTYIYLRPGSPSSLTITYDGTGCAEPQFEVEVNKVAAAFDETRRYHITVNGVSTPTPRELFVEHLISQFRNSITGIQLDGVSIPPGGVLAMVIGNTYQIKLLGGTAPSGYEQFSQFLNIPNTVFEINAISTDYSANSSANVTTTGHKSVYADACYWVNDPNDPIYLDCFDSYKSGGNLVETTYDVRVLPTATSGDHDLNALLYDFSGSSFHYNADFGSGARIITIVDPNNVGISKNFSPDPTNVGGISILTFNLTNSNTAPLTGFNFNDTFPTSPGLMTVYSPATFSTSGCGSPTFAPVAGAGSVSFADGTIAANSTCSVRVTVTADTASGTPYSNTTSTLKIGLLDTGKTATDTLIVNNTPVPPAPPSSCPGQEVELARWTMDTTQGTGTPPAYFSKAADVATATASYVGTGAQSVGPVDTSANSWGATTADASGWSETAVTSANYLQFTLDTSKYGGVRVAYDIGLYANKDWANPISNIYAKSSADGGGYTLYTPTSTANKGNWTTGLVAIAATTGSNTTAFRFSTDGASKQPATLNIDNVIFTGCAKPDPPTMTKSFSPDPVAVNGVSTLTFTLTNPNVTALTAKFLDTLPAGLEVAATPNASTTCTGIPTWAPAAADTSLAFGQATGGTIAASGSCTVSVDIKATTAGPHANVSGFVSATESGVNDTATGVATATLTAVLPPTITKVFGPNPILAGGTSTLTFSVANPNLNKAISGVAFADTFPTTPANMVVAATPNVSYIGCGAGTLTAVAAAGSVSFTGGAIAAGGTCTVTVDITAPTSSATLYANTSGAVTHLVNAVAEGTDTATDSLLVNPASPQIKLLKQVSKSAIGPWTKYVAVATGANVYYKFTVENAGDVVLNPVTVTDPDGVVSPLLAACGWTLSPLPVAIAANDNHIKTCITAATPAVAGTKLNTATASGTYSATPYTDTSMATYATIGVTLVKSAAQSYFTAAGGTINYSYVVSNTGSAVLSGVATVADDKATATCPSFTTAVLKSDGVTAGDGDNFLDTIEQITCTAPYTILAADVTAKSITNVASATISGVTSPTDTVTVLLAPDLQAVKKNSVGGTMSLATYGSTFDWTLTVFNTATAGNAQIADTQVLLKDELPTSGATYAAGTVTKAGATGTINCPIASNVLTCSASGAVTIPSNLTGTISVINGSNAVVGVGTTFTSQLSATSPNNSVILISGVPYTVTAIADNLNLTIYPVYAGADAAGLIVPGSFSVPITVTPTAGGSLVNPKAAGVCMADSGTVVTEINEGNNTCADTVIVNLVPSLTIVKTVATYSDPVNGITSPKSIPGAFVDYTIIVTNTGVGTVDNNSTVITDKIPANTELFVGDIDAAATTSSSPVLFTNGTTASGLTYTFANTGVPATDLNDATDDLSFSGNNGTDYLKNDVLADANEIDASVTDLKVSLKGVLAASDGTNHPSFNLKVRMRVK